MVVPSLFPETFGYVVLEAFAVRHAGRRPRGGGALLETGVLSGGGLGYRTDGELLLALRRIVHDEDLRDDLAARGFGQRIGEWSETEHLDRYFELIGRHREARGIRPALSAPPGRAGRGRSAADRGGLPRRRARPDAPARGRQLVPCAVLVVLGLGLLRAADRRARPA